MKIKKKSQRRMKQNWLLRQFQTHGWRMFPLRKTKKRRSPGNSLHALDSFPHGLQNAKRKEEKRSEKQ